MRALLLAGIAGTLVGCQRGGPGAEAQAWFPLEAGHRWTYRVTTQTGDDASEREWLTLRTLGASTLPPPMAQPAWQRRSDGGIDYWLRADDSGIVRVASKNDLQADIQPDQPPRYVLKGGVVVVEEGQLRRAPASRRLHVRPAFDDAVTRDLRRWFDRYGTVSFDNYPVAPLRDPAVAEGA